MVYVISCNARVSRNSVFIGDGSVFEQKHKPFPWWFSFRFFRVLGRVFTKRIRFAFTNYREYLTYMMSADEHFAASFSILVGLARKGDVTLVCDCVDAGGLFCHGSVMKHYILEALRREKEIDSLL